MSAKPKQEKPDLGRRVALAPTPTTLERRIRRAQTATADERDNALRLLRLELMRRGLSEAEAIALTVESVPAAKRKRGHPTWNACRDERVYGAVDQLCKLFPDVPPGRFYDAFQSGERSIEGAIPPRFSAYLGVRFHHDRGPDDPALAGLSGDERATAVSHPPRDGTGYTLSADRVRKIVTAIAKTKRR